MTATSIRPSIRILVFCLALLCMPVGVLCARPGDSEKHRVNLDQLASALAGSIRTAGVKSITVADFLDADGRITDLTWYLSGKLSDQLRKEVAVSYGPRFVSRGTLADSKMTIEEMRSPESLARIGSVWGVSAIVTGVVESSPEKYVVRATVRNIADDSVVVEAAQDVPHSRILDLLLPGGINQENAHAKTVGADGVGVPSCLYCPIPSYSEDARAAKIQTAKVTLIVTVSASGEAVKLALTKNPGFGLGEKAIEDVSEWKFKPAMQNGKPVTVAVPVDVEFHLART